jgi:predicted DCC family thiol-disulfide oxidoreductase YuxK/uncharacterized membrane protein YphA (DoxX/SURF4 family)
MTLNSAWRRWWFDPVPVTNLAICRILFFGAMFLFYLPQDYAPFGAVSKVFFYPIWFFDRLDLPVLSPRTLDILEVAWLTALALSCVGLFTRLATFASLVLAVYILGLPNNFGSTYHYDTLIILVLATMALSRCGDGWSLDELIRAARRPAGSQLAQRVPSGEYLWPTQMIRLTMALVFFAAGVAKIRHGGLEWILSNNMAVMLVRHHYHIANVDPLTSWGLAIAQYPWMSSLLAGGAMVGETLYPLALFSRRLRPVLVLTVFFMQVGIRVLMGPTFNQYLICNLFWIPWDRVSAGTRRWLPASERYSVIFDGGCGLCQRTVAIVRQVDILNKVEILNVFTDWSTIHARFPDLDEETCLKNMQVVTDDGRRAEGFDGYRLLLRVLPIGWVILPLLFVPGVPFLGRRIYAVVAARRATTTCGLTAGRVT